MTVIASTLLVVGTAFVLLACIGVARMPGPIARMHAAGKATTLGLLLTLAGTAFALERRNLDTGKLVLAAVFLVLTTPAAAHLVARAVTERADQPDADGGADRGGRTSAK